VVRTVQMQPISATKSAPTQAGFPEDGLVGRARFCRHTCRRTAENRGVEENKAAHSSVTFELVRRNLAQANAGQHTVCAVFKMVARRASWSRVGSTPMHLRHPFFELESHILLGSDAK